MVLYRINGNYPNKNFQFSLSASNMSLAPSSHTHSISDIKQQETVDGQLTTVTLTQKLAGKAALNHTHSDMVTDFYVGNPADPETYEGGVVSLSINAVSGTNTPSIAITGGTVSDGRNINGIIELSYVSARTGNIVGVLNYNPQATRIMLQIYSGRRTTFTSTNVDTIAIEENINA